MNKQDYWELKGFSNLYLEDSYVEEITLGSTITFKMTVALKESHELYIVPNMEEQYCYKNLLICFSNVKAYKFNSDKVFITSDQNNEKDIGNIDSFQFINGKYYLEGNWGNLIVFSENYPKVIYI